VRLRAALEAAAAALPEEQRPAVQALLLQIDALGRQRGRARTQALQAFREQGLAQLLAAAPPRGCRARLFWTPAPPRASCSLGRRVMKRILTTMAARGIALLPLVLTGVLVVWTGRRWPPMSARGRASGG
jgi:hypothetical protein